MPNSPDPNINLSLERMQQFCQENNTYRPPYEPLYIHIAGTNGKGSTLIFLQSLLLYYQKEKNISSLIALYTSPHLISLNERIKLNNQNIPTKVLDKYIKEINPLAEEYHLTFFEKITAIFWRYIKEEQANIILLETGLGGRLDATNIIENSISIITHIGLDHCEYLGNTTEKIALEKAHIIKKNNQYILAKNQSNIINTIREYAKSIQAKEIPQFQYTEEQLLNILSNTPLSAHYQLDNLQTALIAFQYIIKKLYQDILTPTECLKIAKKAFDRYPPHWRGRYEKIPHNNKYIIFDGAHNELGFKALIKSIKKDKYEKKQKIIIFGMLGNKNYDQCYKILKEIKQSKDLLIITNIDTPIKLDTEEEENTIYINNPSTAIKKAKELLNDNNYHIALICGSLYLRQYV